ncbi:MAG: hypothetical protein H6686_03420 [Fibrobacteria bacterium]|nr:hypothetical protein [Fibrobacteria bacterium]
MPALRTRSVLVLLLLGWVSSVHAIWSPIPATDTIWAYARTAPILLVRTGNAPLDDAIEEGFRLYWSDRDVSWVPDSGLAAVSKDTVVLVFRLAQGRNPFRTSREDDCNRLEGAQRVLCRDDQTKAVFGLGLVGDRLGHRNGAALLAEPSQVLQLPRGDAFAIDVVQDFAAAAQAVWDSTYPAEGPLKGDRAWARETITKRGRSQPLDTLWIPDQVSGKVSEAEAAQDLGSVVRYVPMDSLERMLGTSRGGAYLEPGLRRTWARQLRVRSVATGELLLIDDGNPKLDVDTVLVRRDFQRLAHRVHGREERLVWRISAEYELASSEVFGWNVLLEREVRRGLLVGAGFANLGLMKSTQGAPTQTLLLSGFKWIPSLGWERKTLGPRFTMGSRLWVPLAEAAPTQEDAGLDLAPRLTLDVEYWARGFTLGLSKEIWLGEGGSTRGAWSGADVQTIESGVAFRFGAHFGFPQFMEAPKWRSAKELASAPKP